MNTIDDPDYRMTFREYCDFKGVPYRPHPIEPDQIIVRPEHFVSFIEELLELFPQHQAMFLPSYPPPPHEMNG